MESDNNTNAVYGHNVLEFVTVGKDKHDCCILDSDGTIRADCFTIPNNMDGFKQLLRTIRDCTKKSDKIKVGLEATGHYSYNILGFLLDNDLAVYVMNPLHTNLYRKSLILATHQQILRIRSHTDINFRQIGSHRRESE